MRFHRSTGHLRRLLEGVNTVLPSRYSQWLIEEPVSGDYRVLSHRLPAGDPGYSTAHRTGLIGQVFRTRKAILASDVHHHVLYDAYDPSIDWELAVPIRCTKSLQAVLNLEGSGAIALTQNLWHQIEQLVQMVNGGWSLPPLPPLATDLPLFSTQRTAVQVGSESARQALQRRARGLASRGKSVLLTGDFPELLRDGYPTLAQAQEQGLPASYCFFALGGGLDHLATGPLAAAELMADCMNWWTTANGRYEQVFVALAQAGPS